MPDSGVSDELPRSRYIRAEPEAEVFWLVGVSIDCSCWLCGVRDDISREAPVSGSNCISGVASDEPLP